MNFKRDGAELKVQGIFVAFDLLSFSPCLSYNLNLNSVVNYIGLRKNKLTFPSVIMEKSTYLFCPKD